MMETTFTSLRVERRYCEPPIAAEVGQLADAYSEKLGSASWPELTSLVADLGVELEVRQLGAATGGTQALTYGRADGSVVMWVDPDPSPDERSYRDLFGSEDELQTNVMRYRVGHEIGHLHFFSVNGYHIPTSDDDNEERFCDLFAAALLVPRGVANQFTEMDDNEAVRREAVRWGVFPAVFIDAVDPRSRASARPL